jgi:hypothetical protein
MMIDTIAKPGPCATARLPSTRAFRLPAPSSHLGPTGPIGIGADKEPRLPPGLSNVQREDLPTSGKTIHAPELALAIAIAYSSLTALIASHNPERLNVHCKYNQILGITLLNINCSHYLDLLNSL